MGKSKTAAKRKPTTTSRKTSAAKASSGAPKKRAAAERDAGAATVKVDRRSAGNRRTQTDRRKESKPVAVERRTVERRKKVNRRRQIDPTTCERDYSPAEVEFMNALDEYKRKSGRMFPTCSEILEVIHDLGYRKQPEGEAAADPVSVAPVDLRVPPDAQATPVA